MKENQPDKKILNTDDIIKVVCEYYNLEPQQVFSNTRKRNIIEARQMVHYMFCKHTKLSLSKIGLITAEFGKRKAHDHASVLHSRNTIQNSIDESIRADAEFINNILKDYKVEKTVTLRDVRAVNMRLSQLLINQRVAIRRLKESRMVKHIYSDADVSILNMLKSMNYQDKQEALKILEVKKKVRENMTHQKLRAS